MLKIFDTHSHCIPPAVAQNTTFFKVFWSDADKQLQTMDAYAIEKALLLYPTSDAHLNMGGWSQVATVYNSELAKIVAKHRSRFLGAGILPVDDPQSILDELKRIQGFHFKAISLASSYDGEYLDSEMFFPVFEFAQKNKMVIHVHPQILNPIGEDRVRDPLLTPVLEYVLDVSVCIGKMMMSGVFLQFPDVKFIFAHYGGVLPIVKERFDTTYAMLRRRDYVKDLGRPPSEYFKNLYFDTSGSKSAASLMCALELADPSHILWGSDYPANQNIADSIATVSNSHLSESQKSSILADNFTALFL